MEEYVFLDGNFISKSDAVIPVQTHALQYGTACFEGIRAYYSENENCLYAFRLEDHFNRFLDSAKILCMHHSYSVADLIRITSELLQRNYSTTDIYIRPFFYKSDTVIGNFSLQTLKSSLCIYTLAHGRHTAKQDGISAMTSSWKRVSDNTIPPRAKISGAYVNTSLAKTEAAYAGYDEAIFLDNNGHILEGSSENIFIIKNKQIITPPVFDDILIGITRDTIIKICSKELGIEIVERSIDKTELYQADEVLLVGTGAEITPVLTIDGRRVAAGLPGTLSLKLKKLYYDIVHGYRTEYNNWLTKISG